MYANGSFLSGHQRRPRCEGYLLYVNLRDAGDPGPGAPRRTTQGGHQADSARHHRLVRCAAAS